jgi:hypothetical protein
MEAFRFASEMAKEGHVVKESFCSWLLERFHSSDPGIKHVYHNYVQEQLRTKRCLTTPFGFTRQFFALRDYGDNKKIVKEGYAQIPQGTVGTNTGMAILWLETYHPGYTILDDHDAVTLEVSDNSNNVLDAISWLQEAFNRIIRLPRGLEFIIPIEFEVGYNLNEMRTVKNDNNLRENITKICEGRQRERMLAVERLNPNVGIRPDLVPRTSEVST